MAIALVPRSMSIEEEAAAEKDWQSLSSDVQERILLRLPISSCIKLAAVSKHWHSTVTSPSFTNLLQPDKHPWFFIWGINELIHTRSLAYAFDPIAASWFTLKTSRPPDFNRASLSGTNGLLFAFSGSKVCFSPTPTTMKWQETPPTGAPRCSCLLGVFGIPACYSDFQLLLVGGMHDGDERMVELYSSSRNAWEICPPLPEGDFFEGISSHWMSSAVVGWRFYVADVYSGHITSFDVESKEWSDVVSLRIPNILHLVITSVDEGLFALCVCQKDRNGACLKLFKVDEVSVACTEVSEMPQELFSLFEDEGDCKEANLRCVGSGNMFYVYSESNYKGYPVCMCYISEACYAWRKLSSLPHPLPHFNRVVCCTTMMTPMACLTSLMSRG